MSRPEGRPRTRPSRLTLMQWPVILWLTVVWVALWGTISPMTVIGGVIVAVVVCLVFPLPRLNMDLHVRPLRLVWLVVRFLADVVAASIHVARVTLRFRREPLNAVVEIDLRTDSDFVLTVVAQMVSLVPGSLVVEARRATHTLFLHVLDVRDQGGVDEMRAAVMALERRVVLAFGTDVHRRRIEHDEEAP